MTEDKGGCNPTIRKNTKKQCNYRQLKTDLKGQPGTYYTKEKESIDELIKFCESIPKGQTVNSNFENNKIKYIKHLAKNETINGIMETDEDNKEDNDLTIPQLAAAFKAEMNIFKYLMSKHKNIRALAFVDLIVEQTYELWKKKCQKEIDEAIAKGSIASDITKHYDNSYDIITYQTAKEYLDTLPKYQGRDEFYKYKPDGKRFVETWYSKKHRDSNIEEEDSVEIDGKKIYMKGMLNYHRGIGCGIDILREAAKKHRHTRGNIFADEFKEIVNASEQVLDLACSKPAQLYEISDFC